MPGEWSGGLEQPMIPSKGRGQLKKHVFFRALPESPNPPPLTPIRATWSFFFGRQNSRFESHLRTISANVGRVGRYINNLKNS